MMQSPTAFKGKLTSLRHRNDEYGGLEMRLRPAAATEQLYAADSYTSRIFADALPQDTVGDPLKAPLPPQLPLMVLAPDIPGDTSSTVTIVPDGEHLFSTLETVGDQDFFKVELQAGITYEIGQYAKIAGPSGVPLQDAYIEIYDAAGNLITAADGGGRTPSGATYGLDALLTFRPEAGGTYYINARAFDQSDADGSTTGDGVGDYELFVDTTTYVPYYDLDSPLHSLDWGTQVDGSSRNPDGAEGPRPTGNEFTGTATPPPGVPAGKNVITYYFAKQGEVFVRENPQGALTGEAEPPTTETIVAKGMEQWEKDAYLAAFGEFAKVADIVYVEVNNQNEADFVLITYPGTPGTAGTPSLLGRMSPPDTANEGQTEFNSNDYRWSEAGLAPGGFTFVTLIHELGHGHGLSHPHDDGGRSSTMRGVEAQSETSVASYTLGDFDLNQGVYTMMSYQDGWELAPYGQADTDAGYGWLGGLMALDIAAIQDKYGVNEEWATGNDTYVLKDVNAAGTFYSSIWDAGGVDTIVYQGARDANIDLRAATLEYEEGGGGRVSYAYGIHGGFTIANSVTIENATSGSGNDSLTGNAAANILDGGMGNDSFDLSLGGDDQAIGGEGNDGFYFGAAFTAADRVNGGGGTNDQIALKGDYSAGLTLDAGSIAGVETIAVLPGFDYRLKTVDANVPHGGKLTIYGGSLGAGDNLYFDGSAEASGAFAIFGGKGTDTLIGGGGNDGFFFGPDKFSAADSVDGGAGNNDQLGLDGHYTLTLGENFTNIEVIALIRGIDADLSTYNLTLTNAAVGAGKSLTIWGTKVETGFTVDGSAESDGKLTLFGGTGGDTLKGGGLGDTIYGLGGADRIAGGDGADRLVYQEASESTGAGYDTIEDFVFGTDRIDLAETVSGIDGPVSGGNLSSASFDADLASILDSDELGANHALLFTASGGTLAGRSFLVVDANREAGYQAGEDYVFALDHPTQLQNLSVDAFI